MDTSKKYITLSRALGFFVTFFLFVSSSVAQGPFSYVTDKATAMALARAQGKGVLMIAGADTCGNCVQFEETALTSSYNSIPIIPVADLIKEAFVYWYCDLSRNRENNSYLTGCKEEMAEYIAQTGKYVGYESDSNLTKGYDLPLEVFIDPAKPHVYREDVGSCKTLRPNAGGPGAQAFYDVLLIRAAHGLGGPIFTNIKDGDVIKDVGFEVKGQNRWVHALMHRIGYRLNGGEWKSKRVAWPQPDNLPKTKKVAAVWSLPLSELAPKNGLNTLEVRAEWTGAVTNNEYGVSSSVYFTFQR